MDTGIDPNHFYTFNKDPVKENGSVTANPSTFLKENKIHAFLVGVQKMSSLHWKVSIFMVDLTNYVTYKFNFSCNFLILSCPTV